MNQFFIKKQKTTRYSTGILSKFKIVKISIGFLLFIFPVLSCQSQQSNTNSGTQTTKTVSNIEHLTTASFKTKIFNYTTSKDWKFVGNKPAIIDFYADWCGPCRSLAPAVAEIAEKYKGKIDVYKVNVDNEQELASYFNIRSIPALLFIPMNEKPQMSVGLISKPDFEKLIQETFKMQ